ncbi:MAG: septal ring factor EnvC (AmiA/AmiB activator) [Bacteroidia bacterium]|jgi:septal ring factor EnvC (AmiA/AmiB activator)
MKRVTKIGLFFGALFVFTVGFAQTKQELTNRLNENQRQLALSKKVFAETLAQERTTLKTLSIYESQIELREQGLDNIQDHLDALDVDIDEAKKEISGITVEIERIKIEFSEAIVLSYKSNKKMSKMHYVFMASSFNDLIRRLNYLKRIMDFRRLQLQLIENKKQENSVRINQLVKKQNQMASSLSEQEDEANELRKEKDEYNGLIENLKAKEDQILLEIQRREKRSQKLEASIRRAIKNSTTTNRIQEFVPGNLPWPVKTGYISERFGRHKHQDFKNVSTQNNGINIICEDKSTVYPVFQGVVSAIIEVPGMHTSVLVKHGGYYSVYANLASVSCTQGEPLTPSSVIGQVGKNEDNVTELHFEIWKGTTKLDPQSWIRR